MATKVCAECGKQLSFRDSYVLHGKDLCEACLQRLDPRTRTAAPMSAPAAAQSPKMSPPADLGSHRLSLVFFLASFVGGIVLAVALNTPTSDLMSGLAVIPFLYSAIIYLIFWYRAWGAIQDGHARTSPGRAVGFMFIPFFNFYWIFQVTWGFAKDFNAYVRRYGLSGRPLSEGLFLASPILVLCSIVPVLAVVALLANLVIMGIMIFQTCTAINALQPHRGSAGAA